MKILFLGQTMNWWFADQYPRCDLPGGIVGTRFIFLRTNKLLKNWRFLVVAVTGQPLPLRCSVNPVSLSFLIKLWTAMWEHSKLGCSFQILYAFQPFSLKAFSMTAFCLSVKAILLRLSELGNCESSEWRPVTSTDFDLHCNGFLHYRNFFTRQRRKKTN